ncbi:ABC transporter permease [Mannheimia bovis]|uniref:ABC transporter permease n=1 Tax=Mannheimia bovis TaxID=2770636 RepID=UPI0024B75EBB|nr:ABC transporter permease [Mannheimia bovis]WHP46849.1 ABC transporter permease [Mannheimia bovis]
MPIKFVDLLQQSWNFMRNQQSFTLFAIMTIVVVQLAFILLLPASPEMVADQQPQQIQIDSSKLLAILMPTVLLGIANLFMTVLMILNIQSINNGNYQNFFQNAGGALKHFLPVLMLQFIMVLPLSLGASFAMASPETVIIALPMLVVGFYFFIKLSIVIYAYLLEKPQKTLSESIKFTFQLSRGKMLPLILFCVISYLLPGMLSRLFAVFGNDFVGALITVVFSAVINVFMAIFSFRFYQVYRQMPAN